MRELGEIAIPDRYSGEGRTDSFSTPLPIESLKEPHVRAQIFNPRRDTLSHKEKEQLIKVRYESAKKIYEKPGIIADLYTSSSSVVLLRDERNNLVGYAYALPKDSIVAQIKGIAVRLEHPSHEKEEEKKERKEREKGIVRPLVRRLEKLLLTDGFLHAEIEVEVSNGYAEEISAEFDGRIIDFEDHDDTYGQERFLRVRLGNSPKEVRWDEIRKATNVHKGETH